MSETCGSDSAFNDGSSSTFECADVTTQGIVQIHPDSQNVEFKDELHDCVQQNEDFQQIAGLQQFSSSVDNVIQIQSNGEQNATFDFADPNLSHECEQKPVEFLTNAMNGGYNEHQQLGSGSNTMKNEPSSNARHEAELPCGESNSCSCSNAAGTDLFPLDFDLLQKIRNELARRLKAQNEATTQAATEVDNEANANPALAFTVAEVDRQNDSNFSSQQQQQNSKQEVSLVLASASEPEGIIKRNLNSSKICDKRKVINKQRKKRAKVKRARRVVNEKCRKCGKLVYGHIGSLLCHINCSYVLSSFEIFIFLYFSNR